MVQRRVTNNKNATVEQYGFYLDSKVWFPIVTFPFYTKETLIKWYGE